MRVVFEAAALAEYAEAIEFYESIRPGSSDAFSRSLEDALLLLAAHPRIAPTVLGIKVASEVRQKHVKEFAYRIIYVLSQDELRVVALAHTSRAPGYWRDRLGAARKR